MTYYDVILFKGDLGRFPFDQKFRKFRVKSEWKGHFPEYHFGILGVPRELVPIFRKIGITGGAFHSTKNSGYSGWGSEWNRHFPEFHSEILGVPREVGLKFRKIGITGKYCSIRHIMTRRKWVCTGSTRFRINYVAVY